MSLDKCLRDTALRQAIGARIRKARENLKIACSAAAEHFEVTTATIYGWECGTRFPLVEHLKAMLPYYGVSADSLLVNNSDQEFEKELFLAAFRSRDESGQRAIGAAIEELLVRKS